jgi:hypothetical protein
MMIQKLAGIGLRTQEIAYIVDIPHAKLIVDYAHDMNVGISKANMRVANALWETASDRKHKSHATAGIYWSKARMGWAETAARPAEDVPESGAAADASHLTDDAVKDRFAETMDALRNVRR